MCRYKEIVFSRKAKRLYFGGIILAFLIAISAPIIIPYYVMKSSSGKYRKSPFGGITHEEFKVATDLIYDEIKEWGKLPFVDMVIISNTTQDCADALPGYENMFNKTVKAGIELDLTRFGDK